MPRAVCIALAKLNGVVLLSGDGRSPLVPPPLPPAPGSISGDAPGGHRLAFSTEGFDPRDPTLALVDADSGKVPPLPI